MSAAELVVFRWIAALFAAIAVGIVIGQRATGRRIERIWRMYATEVGIVAWVLVPAALGPAWFFPAMAITAAVAALELARLHRRVDRPALVPVVVGASVAFVGLAALPSLVPVLAAPLALAVALTFLAPLVGGIDGAHERTATTLVASLYPGFCLALCARLITLEAGFGAVVFLLVVLELNDALAFLTGRLFGRRPLAPRLSPKKTIEGSLGGLAGSAGVGALLAFVLPGVGPALGAVLGLGLGVLGQAADLAASSIKRQAGVKDFADTIPTQGGVLDVYDAFALVAPVWFLVLSLTL